MIKVNVLEYQNRKCWSLIKKKYYQSDNIEDQIWAHDNVPIKTSVLPLEEAIKLVKERPGDSKAHRNAFFKFDVGQVPLKQFVGLDKWTGIIYADLDLDKDPKILKFTREQHTLLYKQLDFALKNLLPNNYCYIEHSSSCIGIHVIFYFNCEKTIENYKLYAEYIYHIFRYNIDDYIKDFSHIFTDPDCVKTNGRSKVFDDVYSRPYQKFYMTAKDCIYYNVNGDISDIDFQLEIPKIQEDEKEIKTNGQIDIKFITTKKKYTTDYYDRLYVLTALKRYVGDREQAYKLWYDFCQQLTLYKSYQTKDFINMFEHEWDKIRANEGHITVLMKYGFKVDDSQIYYHLNNDQYLSDVTGDIISNCVNGINMVVADTGIGKTKSWIMLNDEYSNPLNINLHKPVLVVEPLNSIIETKYDAVKFNIVTGSKQIGNLTSYEMIITNYNHLVKYTIDGIEVRQDIDSFFSKFELVIIDESHIMMKDVFRSDVLIPFLLSLNKIQSTKIIIQTATPMFETSVLNIKKTFYVTKPNKTKKKIIFRNAGENFNIQDITCLVDYYINNHKKVYVYWSNGSLQAMNQFKSLYHSPDKVVIYHKRNRGNIDMQYVTEHHNISQFDIIMSSVYFGVGNDLEDILDDVAVVIIGNNTWQEDIQADGRWRNVNNVEICVILEQYDMDIINDSMFTFVECYNNLFRRYKNILNDKYNRDKSVIINRMSFCIKNIEYADTLAKMGAAIEYCSQFKVKCTEFEKRGYDVRTTIKPLESNKDYLDELKKYKKNLKDVRNKEIKNMLNGIYNYHVINKDTKLERISRIIKLLQNRELIKLCDMKKFVYSKIVKYESFLRYYDLRKFNLQDYAELFAVLWVRDNLNKDNKSYEFNYKNNEKITIEYNDYVIMCGYLIWLSYRNKTDNKEMIKYFYFHKFKKTCEDMYSIEQKLIDKLIIEHYYDDSWSNIQEEFVNKFYDVNLSRIELDDNIKTKTIEMILEVYSGKYTGNIGNQSKKCIITEKITESRIDLLKKYNLKIGQEFESCSYLGKYINKSNHTIAEWRNKGWIK